jgi:hypothetical protein
MGAFLAEARISYMRRPRRVVTLATDGAARRNAGRDDRDDHLIRDRDATDRQMVAEAEAEEGAPGRAGTG